jgi:hypothetical protein
VTAIDVARLRRRPHRIIDASRPAIISRAFGCDALDDLPCRQHLAHRTHQHPGVKRQLLDVTYDLRKIKQCLRAIKWRPG